MFEPLKDFPMYGINREGQIVNFKTGHIKKHTIDHKGYPRVSLYINDKSHYKLVHRLLAITFLPNPDELPQVNHMDGDPANFEIDNLEWCTAQHNVLDGFKRGRRV